MLPRLRQAPVLPGLHGRIDFLRFPARQESGRWCSAELERGWVVASETAALDIVGGVYIRESIPRIPSPPPVLAAVPTTFAKPDPKGCLFEYVYFGPHPTPPSRASDCTRSGSTFVG